MLIEYFMAFLLSHSVPFAALILQPLRVFEGAETEYFRTFAENGCSGDGFLTGRGSWLGPVLLLRGRYMF